FKVAAGTRLATAPRMSRIQTVLRNVSARSPDRASQGAIKMESSPRDELLSFHSETTNAPDAAPRPWNARRGIVVISAATLLGLACAAVVYIASTRLQAARTVTQKVDPSSGTAS